MRLAQLGELVGGQVEILDPQRAHVGQVAHVVDQPVVDQPRPVAIEGARQIGKARALGHHQAEHVAAEV